LQRKQTEAAFALVKQERDLLNEKVQRLEEKAAAQADLLAKLEARTKLLQEQAARSLEENKAALGVLESHKKLAFESNKEAADLKLQLEGLKVPSCPSRWNLTCMRRATTATCRRAWRPPRRSGMLRRTSGTVWRRPSCRSSGDMRQLLRGCRGDLTLI
jgi:hypothetical protein